MAEAAADHEVQELEERASPGEAQEDGEQEEPRSHSEEDAPCAAGVYDCHICLDTAADPVVTLCGHLFCWPCLYQVGVRPAE